MLDAIRQRFAGAQDDVAANVRGHLGHLPQPPLQGAAQLRCRDGVGGTGAHHLRGVGGRPARV